MTKVKAFVFLIGLLLSCSLAQAQIVGSLTASDSGSCGTTNACVSAAILVNMGTAGVSISGTFSATVQFEGIAGDSTNWTAISGTPVGSTTTATSATAVGIWRFPISGLTAIRVRCSSYASGTVVVTIIPSNQAASLGGGGVGSGTVTNSGTLTNNALLLGAGTTVAKADSGCSTDAAGNLTCVSFTASGASASYTDWTTGAFADTTAGHARCGAFTGDIFECAVGATAKKAVAFLGGGDVGGTQGSEQVNDLHLTTSGSLGTVGLTISVANAGATGTTASLLAKINASGNAVLPATTDTGIPMAGVCTTANGGVCGTSGSANLITTGVASCLADNTVTTGDSIGVGTTTAGRCKSIAAAGTAPAAGLKVVGTALGSAVAGGAFNVVISPEASYASTFPTLDQLGNAAASKTFANGANGIVITSSNSPGVNVQTTSAASTGFRMSTSQASPTATCIHDVEDSSSARKWCVDSQYHIIPTNNYAILTSDFTDASSASLQAITGLSFTTPVTNAQNIPFECHLMYSQATNVSDQFGIQISTNNPTRVDAEAKVTLAGPGASAPSFGVLANLATTTATAIVTFTPTATTTNYADIQGLAQIASNASTSGIQFMVQQSTAADVIVIKAGSWCALWP